VKTCFDCQWAQIDRGYHGDRENPPEPASAECDKVDGEYLDELNTRCSDGNYASRCRHFKAVELECCPVCGFKFDVPAYDWNIFAFGYDDPVAVCSVSCQSQLQDKFNKDIEEDQRGYQENYA
jgi:hypothetical protein